jgi:cytochrome c-type biogenesis protein CcmE
MYAKFKAISGALVGLVTTRRQTPSRALLVPVGLPANRIQTALFVREEAMHPKRKQRLTVALLVVVLSSTAVGLVSYALRGNINLFYPPTEVVAGKAPSDRSIRVGGMVVAGSIKRSNTDLTTTFTVTDYDAEVTISYTGILPDLFAEGEGVVAAGTLDDRGVLVATEVLAKHDENYMPPEVAAALEGKQPTPARDSYSNGTKK